jgi:AraC family transcriptional regulator
MVRCSWRSGWRSLLLREYLEPAVSGPFTTAPCHDHLIVLILEGPCAIRARYGATWQEARYEVGSIGMTRPGVEARLEFSGETCGRTLQLHLPAATLERVARELSGSRAGMPDLSNELCFRDELIRQTMLGLSAAMNEGVPDLYAQSCAEMLAAHLLVRHGGRTLSALPPEDARARRVDEFMRENLEEDLSLEDLADVAGVSSFHLIRLFKAAFGETPYRRLTRLRMDAARARLLGGDESITDIALSYGYLNPAHFAAAFRRLVGAAPGDYRRGNRGW